MCTKVLPLIYFSHAELKSREHLNAKLELVTDPLSSNAASSKFDQKNAKSRKKLRLNIDDEDMSYEALEEDDQPFLIADLNRETNEISLYNTPCFIMKPSCYLNNQASSDSSNPNLSVSANATYSEKLDHLTAAFGSSKKRKAMQTKLKNKLDSDTLESAVSAAVDESKKKIQQENRKDESHLLHNNNAELEQFSVMPTPNKDAKSPQDVYNMNEILNVTQVEFDRFTIEQSTKFASASIDTIKKWKEKGVYSEYVIEHLIDYANAKYGHQYKLQKCKQLAFMNYLLSLYALKSTQLRTKSPLSAYEVPDSVINRLFDNYTVVQAAQSRSMRSMPRRLKDKLTCHILILALYIDDFSTNMDTFQKDLKLSMQRLSDFYQTLGAYVKSQINQVNGKKIVSKKAVLSLPLNEYKAFESKKKQRKN